LLDEPYLDSSVKTTSMDGAFYDFIVPDGCVFAMGDNRSDSKDCRVFGCIPLNKIEGTVLFRMFPLNKFGKID
jgi:signal peptidase I